MSDLQSFTMTDAEAFFAQVLRAVEHGDGDRRRRQGRRDHPDPREVLRPHPGGGQAARRCARSSRRRSPRSSVVLRRPVAAVLPRGLPQAGRRRTPTSRSTTRIADVLAAAAPRASTGRWCATRSSPCRRRSVRGLPRRQVPEPVRRLRGAGARRHQRRRSPRRSAPRSSGCRPRTSPTRSCARFKTRAKADLIRALDSNQGLAEQLADVPQRSTATGASCSATSTRIEKVTKADIRRVAAETFSPTNRTVAMIENDCGAGRAEATR